MNIQHTTVTKLRITQVEDLDPIDVYLEDLEPHQGKITINCWERSWTAFWPGMGFRLISEFFRDCNNGYLIGCLAPHMEKYEPDFDAFCLEMRQKVCEMRRDYSLSKELARELYDVDDWSDYVTSNPYEPIRNPCFLYKEEFEQLDFEGFDVPERLTADYRYLSKIIETVKEALGNLSNAHSAICKRLDQTQGEHNDSLQASCPQVSAPAKSVVVSLEPIVKKVVIDLAMGIRIRSECNIEQPFDVKRSIKSIGRRIYGCIQISDFERAARLHKVYAALKEVSDGKH
ncbi:hypothetical protein B9J90_18170 [Vibrio sp. V09_P4A23P171]|uniref:hypothetical protein n=1 Tax=Vibrio sp. V09_P4A23P171 TaxID=1938664 RepID=UPI000B8E7F14|nr:hypothetical protein [Vibrio sp. V09_P4A23P171]OXX31818.1 hypothetical protein B9J90_18170 [Vibrio sp. V09_P4A23P171]